MPIQLKAFSYPPDAAFISDFPIQPLNFPLISHSIPGTSSPFSLSQPLQGAACPLGSPDLLPTAALLSGQGFIFILCQSLSTWMFPNLIPPKPSVNSTFWLFFLMLANHRPSRKDQVVARRWSVCGLNALWPCLRVSLVATRAAEGSCPKAPQHFQTPVGKSTEVSTSMPLATPLLRPNKGKEDKDITEI